MSKEVVRAKKKDCHVSYFEEARKQFFHKRQAQLEKERMNTETNCEDDVKK